MGAVKARAIGSGENTKLKEVGLGGNRGKEHQESGRAI